MKRRRLVIFQQGTLQIHTIYSVIIFERTHTKLLTKIITNAIFDGRIERIDDGGAAMSYPVSFIHWFSQLFKRITSTE